MAAVTVQDLVCYLSIDPAPDPGSCEEAILTNMISSTEGALQDYLNNYFVGGLRDFDFPMDCSNSVYQIPAKEILMEGGPNELVYGVDTWVKIGGELVPIEELRIRNRGGLVSLCGCCGRRCGCCNSCDMVDIRVYTGTDPVSPCLKQAIMELIGLSLARQIQNQYLAGASGVSSSSSPTVTGLVKSEKIGDYTVVYDNFQGGESSSSGSFSAAGCGCSDLESELTGPSRMCLKSNRVISFY